MQLTKLTPMLYTNDLQGTVDFYTQTLGFTCKSISKELDWASLTFGDIDIMVSLPNEHIPFDKANFTGSFYFLTNNADIFWEQLKDKTSICYPIEDFEYGMREFAIYDNNGYLLQFGHELAS